MRFRLLIWQPKSPSLIFKNRKTEKIKSKYGRTYSYFRHSFTVERTRKGAGFFFLEKMRHIGIDMNERTRKYVRSYVI